MADNSFTPLTTTDKEEDGEKTSNKKDTETVRDHAKHAVEVLLLALFWWIAAVFVAFMFKWTAARDSTLAIHPLMLTWLVNTVVGLIAWMLAKLYQRIMHKNTPPKQLSWMNVATLEQMNRWKAIVSVLFIVGGILQGVGLMETNGIATTLAVHVAGIGLQLLSIVLAAVFWTMIQLVIQRVEDFSHLSKLQILAITQPAAGLVCFVLTLALEIDGLILENWLNPMLLLRIPALAVGTMAIAWSQYVIIHFISAVSIGILMDLLFLPLALPGIILAGETYGVFSIIGFVICFLGALFYMFALHKDSQHAKGNMPKDPPIAS